MINKYEELKHKKKNTYKHFSTETLQSVNNFPYKHLIAYVFDQKQAFLWPLDLNNCPYSNHSKNWSGFSLA